MLRREDFNNDQVDAGEIGAGHAVTAIYEITPVGGGARSTIRCAISTQRRADSGRPRQRVRLPAHPLQAAGRAGEPPDRAPDHQCRRLRDIARAPAETRWATAVAGYGQLLRGDPYLDRTSARTT